MHVRPHTTAIRPVLAVAALLVATAVPASAADWPQWRGPERDGRSPETGLAPSWPAGGPPKLLTAKGLGAGYASVAVAGKRVYTLGDLDGAQYAIALDGTNGQIAWKTKIGPAHEDRYGGPRSTPTVDGDRLYVLSTEGNLACLKTADGSEVWSKDIVETYGAKMMMANGEWNWRFSESPLVDGDRVLVTPGVRSAAIVALDKKSGAEIFKASMPELGEAGVDGAGYSSIVVSEAAGVRHYVQFLGRGAIGVAEDGRFLWGYNRIANEIANIATPLVHGDEIFLSSGYGRGSALLRIRKSDDGVKAEEVWFLDGETLQNHHGGLIRDGETVYTGTGHNKGFPIAVRWEDGEILWGPVRNAGKSSAAISYADGRLYMRYQNGLMLLVEATPEGYSEQGAFMIPDVEKESWAHPVIAGGRLWLREQDALHVYDLSGGTGGGSGPGKAAAD